MNCQITTQTPLSLPIDECVGPFGKPRPWGSFYYSK